jgi:FkbM family methyltransferase
MPIEPRRGVAEVRGYAGRNGDSHTSLGSRLTVDRPLPPQIAEKVVKIEHWKPQAWASAAKTLLKEVWRKWEYLNAQEGFRRAPLLTICRLILWRVRCLLGWSATIDLRGSNVQFFLPAQWRGIEKIIFAFREDYEPELTHLEKVLSPGMTFVDVGACYGIYTLAASKIVGGTGHVIAFEPSSRALPILRKNIALNNLTNVQAFPLALSEKSGRAWLYRHPNVGCDSLASDDSFTEEAEETVTELLDNILRQLDIDRVDVIKMDVQGAEEWVLRGARKTLTSMRPIVIFESWPVGPPLLGLSPNGAWELLNSVGYEFFVFDGCGSLVWVKSPPADRNLVAIYRELKGEPRAPGEADTHGIHEKAASRDTQ